PPSLNPPGPANPLSLEDGAGAGGGTDADNFSTRVESWRTISLSWRTSSSSAASRDVAVGAAGGGGPAAASPGGLASGAVGVGDCASAARDQRRVTVPEIIETAHRLVTSISEHPCSRYYRGGSRRWHRSASSRQSARKSRRRVDLVEPGSHGMD